MLSNCGRGVETVSDIWKMLAAAMLLMFCPTFSVGQLVVEDIDGTATDGLYVYIEGASEDILTIPSSAPEFWTISTPTANTLLFDTQITVGLSTAEVTLTGLESNTDWLSASVTGTGSVPLLTYDGGDSIFLDFYSGGGSWVANDTFTITFEPAAVPEPTSAGLLGLAFSLVLLRRKRAA